MENFIQNIANDNTISNDTKIGMIWNALSVDKTTDNYHSVKDMLLEQAKDSGKTKFRLLCGMNDIINSSLFNWCDTEDNFIGMCHAQILDECVVDYTLEELPNVIDNAEQWIIGVKKPQSSQRSFYTSNIQLMSV